MRVELRNPLRFGRFLPFESRSSTTIHTLFTSKPVVVNSGLLLRKRKLLLCWLTIVNWLTLVILLLGLPGRAINTYALGATV